MKKSSLSAIVVTTSLLFSAAPAHAQSSLSSGSLDRTTQVAPEDPNEDITLSEFEAEVIALTNHHRAAAGAGPVSADETLMTNSQAWSEMMADTEIFEHSGRWNVAENIARHGDANASAATIMDLWLNSPGHRANLLNPDYTKIGIGTAVSETGDLYATQQLIW